MSLRKIILKTRLMIHQLCLGIMVTALGASFLYLHRHPGVCSNIVAWLETEGMDLSMALGVFLFFLGIWLFTSSIKRLISHQIAFTKGPLVISVQSGLLEQIVQQLWSEYFDRPDLRAYVSLHGNHLDITGETPEGWHNEEELIGFLSHKLLAQTGYWGKLSLHTAPEATTRPQVK